MWYLNWYGTGTDRSEEVLAVVLEQGSGRASGINPLDYAENQGNWGKCGDSSGHWEGSG